MREMRSIGLIALIALMVISGCSNDEGWVTIDHADQEIDELQAQVDNGHTPGALDWRQVARQFLQAQTMPVNESVDLVLSVDEEGKKVVQYVLQDGQRIDLELIQPDRKGETGIYVVSRYRLGK